jgi:hypothetical protein
MHKLLVLGGALALTSAPTFAQAAKTHDLKLLPQNVHWGYQDASVKPVLRVASGDTIRVETMIARGLQRLRAAGVKEDEISTSRSWWTARRACTRCSPSRCSFADPQTNRRIIIGAERACRIVNATETRRRGAERVVSAGGAGRPALVMSDGTQGAYRHHALRSAAHRERVAASRRATRSRLQRALRSLCLGVSVA